jgi:hypothetical protein
MTSADAAHYLHDRASLGLVVRAYVRGVTTVAWGPRDTLYAGTTTGEVHATHTVEGTRLLHRGFGPTLRIAVHGDELIVVESQGVWRRLALDGTELQVARHAFVEDVDILFDGTHLVLVGTTATDRRIDLWRDGKRVQRMGIPMGAMPLAEDGVLRLAWVSNAGLEVLKLAPGLSFRGDAPGGARLTTTGGHLIGLLSSTVHVWTPEMTLVCSARARAPTVACASADGRTLALGTASGGVAIVHLHSDPREVAPATVHASDDPIAALAFDPTGRWLASGSSRLCVWSVEPS